MRSFSVALAVVLLVGAGGEARAALIGPTGPDAFGHQGNDIAYNLRDISSTGTFLSLSDDNWSGLLPLGFTFDFYGTNFTGVHVAANGFLDFNGGDHGCCSGRPLPSVDSVSGGIIAGFWEDLNYPQGNIRYQTLGSPGSQEFVVGFYNVQHFWTGIPVSFEMILHEGSNNIEFQYRDAPSDGGTHSIGIERPDETDGLQVLLQGSGSPLPLVSQGYLITNVIPEPSTLLVWSLLAGLGLCVGWRRRKR
jgi:hypothetical protein